MKERTIMIFPKFDNIEVINSIRKKYDPLCDLVNPHITLVFPFKSELSKEELLNWISAALKGFLPFILKLSGVSKSIEKFGNYISLDVVEGYNSLEYLNNKLYDGILKNLKSNKLYMPHMTIGNLKTIEELDLAYEDVKKLNEVFYTIVDTISVEIIGEKGESIIEIEYKLCETI